MGRTEQAIADFERFLELSTDPYWRQQAEQQLRELRGEWAHDTDAHGYTDAAPA
jgi:hypothetical protein